jgi:phosphomethylpyrimidine synthase
MKITAEVRAFAAKQRQAATTPLPEQGGAGGGSNSSARTPSEQEAQSGMAEMSERFRETGGELYLKAGE